MEKIKRKSISGEEVLKRDKHGSEGAEWETLSFPTLNELPYIAHLFSTRTGGVSEGDLWSMNLSFTRGDNPNNVRENYKRIGKILGCEPEYMVASHQTHTTNIRRVTADDCGKGITIEKDYADVDGLITDIPGISLVTYFADCVPLYFVDPEHRAIGLAHSGWKGTAGKMGACMVKRMQEAFGSKPEKLIAAIGPSICVDCYEVSEDVAEQFYLYKDAVLPGKEPGKYQLNLWEINRQILIHAGVLQEHISVTDICTCCNPTYLFSHRASKGKRGNLAAFLMIKPN